MLPLEGKRDNWVASALLAALVIIPLTKWLAPGLIPFSYFGVWDSHGTGFADWMRAGWPLLAYGLVLSSFLSIYKKIAGHKLQEVGTKRDMFFSGLLVSLWAGVAEEIAFRWFLFYGSFAFLAIGNFLFFGWLGFGLPQWLNMHLLAPVANWTTFGYLQGWIYYPGTWIVGASLLSANSFFRDGHKYLGIVGFINSWFVGMFLFYMMFNFGLMSAIILHFSYDVIIFTMAAIVWGD